MLTGPGKLRQAIDSAGDKLTAAAQNTGQLVIAALAVAAAALLAALAALLMVRKVGRTLAS